MIETITDVYMLRVLEMRYEEYLENYQHILLLHNMLGEYLNIRDALIMRKNKMIRNIKKNEALIMTRM